MKKFMYLIPATLLMVASCATNKSVYQLSGDWNVVNLNGQAISPAENTPFVGFDTNEGRIYGFTGCNRITGTLDAKQFMKGKVDFSQLGSTRMLCHDDKYETAFLEALSKAVESEVKEKEILLKDKDGKVVVTLQKK